MALITEDGTAKSNAESLASVAAADTRLAAMGMTTWATLSTTEKEQALRRSTAWMIQTYRSRWKGSRLTSTQALDWPRYNVCVDGWLISSAIVPLDVVNTCIDMAFKAAAGDLTPDLAQAVKSKKVGSVEVVYQDNSNAAASYRAADRALAAYLSGGGGIRIVRA
jgi:hypothetical protein